uniref:Peptidase S1 domain-containing protein n=1 Tax=Timema cristinae TaxID=61476 RepID=A0A7R9C9G2_TIMCR|nr:unnamed protein product [Timema cristinae]
MQIKCQAHLFLFTGVGDIKLNASLEFGPNVQPVELPAQNETLAPGTPVIVSGWGATDASNEILSQSDFLMEVEVLIVDDNTCHMELEGYTFFPSMICAGVDQGGKDSCTGDSGGPLVTKGVQYGIVSWGPNSCAEPEQPGVYTSTSVLRDWIQEKSEV